MNVQLFEPGIRLAILIAFGAMASACLVSSLLRKPRLAALLAVISGLLATSLLTERLASYLVERNDAGSTEFNEYRWIFLSPLGKPLMAIGLIAGVLSILFTALSTRQIHSAWRWSAIVGLRCAAILVAMVLFLQPAVELRQVARNPNRIAILVDDSASMELADEQGGPSRREKARALLENSQAVLEEWGKSHIIDIYRFSDELMQSSLATVATKASTGKETLLRLALQNIRRRYDGDELAGAIVVSDGSVTGDLAEIGTGEFRDFAQELDAPIHTVWAAQKGLKDQSVAEVNADEFAFVRSVTRIEAVIQSTGYGARKVPVTLSSDGKAMRRKWVNLEEGQSSASVFFEFTPSHVGKYVYKISIPVNDDEAVTANNNAWFVLRVIRDKIRVLQVAGQPSWDVRALRGMLKQNPNVDLISFFILRTNSDIKKAGNDELSLIPFPTRELFENELPSFDLVVLQNFNYGPYGIGRYLENIRSYVEGGGGLVMLGGPLSFSSGKFGGTPVAKALPVVLSTQDSNPSELLDTSRFSPRLTKLGGVHPVTALRYEADDNQAVWKSLPQLEGLNYVLKAKKSASVLAVHPRLKDTDNQPMPLIVAGDYGKGRSLAITTDSLWRWGFVAAAKAGNDGRHYLKFWDNAIRWLIQDPELRYLHVDSDRSIYFPGDTLRLNLRLLDQDYTPLKGGKIEISIAKGFDPQSASPVSTQTVTVGEDGEGSMQLDDMEAGVYRVDAQATVRGRLVKAQDIVLVHQASIEQSHPAAESAVLKMISQLSGGHFLPAIRSFPADLTFIAPKIVRVDQRRDVSLWSMPWLLLCALLFLGLEWVLRQRSGSL